MSDAKSLKVAAVADGPDVSDAAAPNAFGSAQKALYDQVVQEIEAFVRSIGEQEAANVLMASSVSSKRQRGGVRPPQGDDLSVSEGSDGDAPTLRSALRLRVRRAIDGLVDRMPPTAMLEAVAAPTDFEALIVMIQEGAVLPPPVPETPLAGAMARAVVHKQEILAQIGPMLPVSEVQNLLGISRQAVDKRRERGSLLGVRLGHSWFYPEIQFDMANEARVYPAVNEVLKIHEGDSAWVVFDALLANDPAFGGRTLLDVVRAGEGDLIELYGRQMKGDGCI